MNEQAVEQVWIQSTVYAFCLSMKVLTIFERLVTTSFSTQWIVHLIALVRWSILYQLVTRVIFIVAFDRKIVLYFFHQTVRKNVIVIIKTLLLRFIHPLSIGRIGKELEWKRRTFGCHTYPRDYRNAEKWRSISGRKPRVYHHMSLICSVNPKTKKVQAIW